MQNNVRHNSVKPLTKCCASFMSRWAKKERKHYFEIEQGQTQDEDSEDSQNAFGVIDYRSNKTSCCLSTVQKLSSLETKLLRDFEPTH